MRIKKVSQSVGVVGTVADEHTEDNNAVYNAPYINGLNGKILWENSNPTSAFTAQTITLSSDDYDIYEIFYSLDKDNPSDVSSVRSIKGKNAILQGMRATGSTSPFRVRNCTYSNATQLQFAICYYGANGLTSTSNDYIIPLYVIGYKTGLFS